MQIRRRYHLSYSGVLYVGVTVILAIGAINSQNNLLFIALGLALGALLVSGALSGAMLMGLRAERDDVLPGAVGGPMTIRYTITNRSRILPAFGLVITELPGERARSIRQIRRLLLGAGVRRLFRRRRSGATWPLRTPRPLAHIAHVPPRSGVRAAALVEPFRRGVCVFEGVRITSSFPFGILRKSVDFAQPASALVRPQLAATPESLLRRIATVSDTGESESLRTGRGADYLGLRDYVPGDSMRRIAWRASARTGELVVLETTPPAAARLWIGLEFGAATDDESAAVNERAISLCAGLIDRALRAGLQVGLAAPACGLVRPPGAVALKGQRAAYRFGLLLDDLARLDVSAAALEARRAPLPIGGRDACIVISASRRISADWPRGVERYSVTDSPDVETPLTRDAPADPPSDRTLQGATA